MKLKTPEELKKTYPDIPIHMLHAIVGYRDFGHRQGSFGAALLSNSLLGAFGSADDGKLRIFITLPILIKDPGIPPTIGNRILFSFYCRRL